jgi:hypothetical protein
MIFISFSLIGVRKLVKKATKTKKNRKVKKAKVRMKKNPKRIVIANMVTLRKKQTKKRRKNAIN